MEIGTLAAVASAALAALSAATGAVTYHNAQRCKRTEFAGAQTARLVTDPELSFCCTALDWGTGAPLLVPPRFRELAGSESFEHDWALLKQAMRPVFWLDQRANPRQFIYRHSFDCFFSYLNWISSRMDAKLIKGTDIEEIFYYTRLIRRPTYFGETDSEKEDVFIPFLRAFGYKRVLSLINCGERQRQHVKPGRDPS